MLLWIVFRHGLVHLARQLFHGQVSSPSVWDRPGLQADRVRVEASVADATQKASYSASVAPHSGDWLLALPITSCGLRLNDEAVRVAVGARFGLSFCISHKCSCRAEVDAEAHHAMVCKKSPGRLARHHALNDIVCRQLNGTSAQCGRSAQWCVGRFSKRHRHVTDKRTDRQTDGRGVMHKRPAKGGPLKQSSNMTISCVT